MGSAERPAHRFRFRAEMGLRPSRRPLCWRGTGDRNLIDDDETTADHTHGHHGIGDRPSVAAGAGLLFSRRASVRRGDGRADHGRYRDARRRSAGAEEGRAAESKAVRCHRPAPNPARRILAAGSPPRSTPRRPPQPACHPAASNRKQAALAPASRSPTSPQPLQAQPAASRNRRRRRPPTRRPSPICPSNIT